MDGEIETIFIIQIQLPSRNFVWNVSVIIQMLFVYVYY